MMFAGSLLSAKLMAAPFRLGSGSEGSPTPYGALPSHRQLKWHELETYSFLHFTVNTFTTANGVKATKILMCSAARF